ncbi:MAG: hypothetical protein PG977_000184 [Bartonella clarridgeiae]|nr:MAG: hypothetical protein PG977_000184 [Bartonella clarridgeiae]
MQILKHFHLTRRKSQMQKVHKNNGESSNMGYWGC